MNHLLAGSRDELMRLAPTLTNVDQVLAIIDKRLGPVLEAASNVVLNAKSHVGISKVEETYVFALERALAEAVGGE